MWIESNQFGSFDGIVFPSPAQHGVVGCQDVAAPVDRGTVCEAHHEPVPILVGTHWCEICAAGTAPGVPQDRVGRNPSARGGQNESVVAFEYFGAQAVIVSNDSHDSRDYQKMGGDQCDHQDDEPDGSINQAGGIDWHGTSIAYFTTSVGVSAARLGRIDDPVFSEVVDQRGRTGGEVV